MHVIEILNNLVRKENNSFLGWQLLYFSSAFVSFSQTMYEIFI
uniref:Uncharacterized protein n=1 Tax=Arundo donax TaxID=35708 RepID=A0A0A8Y6R9_ARUDO